MFPGALSIDFLLSGHIIVYFNVHNGKIPVQSQQQRQKVHSVPLPDLTFAPLLLK